MTRSEFSGITVLPLARYSIYRAMIAGLLVPLMAVTVINGNTSSSTRVKTTVSGENAQVNTRVTTTVNGETVTVTNDTPGSVEVKRDGNSSEVIINGQPITPTITYPGDQSDKKPERSTSSGEADVTIGDTPETSLRYYVYGFFKRTARRI